MRLPQELRAIGAAVALVALASCSTTEQAPPKADKVAGRDWIAEINAEVDRLVSDLEIRPLADPEVSDLRRKGDLLISQGKLEEAKAVANQAIALRPGDPALWQWQAEISLRRHDWWDAEHQAIHANDLGPKLGSLCVRHWLTVKAARTERRDEPGITSADAQAAACIQTAPKRM